MESRADGAEQISLFAMEAEHYCAFLDGPPPADAHEALRQLAQHLAALYQCALALPKDEASHDWAPRRALLPERTRQRLADHAGLLDRYWEVFDPLVHSEPLVASLVGDLHDIYLDLTEGLLHYREGKSQSFRDAAWSWRFSFYSHWGDHLVDALRAVQRHLAKMERGPQPNVEVQFESATKPAPVSDAVSPAPVADASEQTPPQPSP
jgi:hypothetical protein